MPTPFLRHLGFLLFLLCSCAVSTGPSHETTPEDRIIFTEQPVEGEPAADPTRETAVDAPTCDVAPEEPDPSRQIEVFRRWFQDQSVGRDVATEELEPTCGDRGGFLVFQLTVTGPAGGLQSMSNALEAYYPGSSWSASSHERLEGEDYPLRIRAEILVPVGESPRPRCEWDEELECE